MGYRSEVGFIVPKDAPKFEEIEDSFDLVEERGDYRFYYGSSLKWYDEYPVVKAVTEYLKANHEKCLFVRVGEDLGDCVEEGGLWDNPFDLGIRRHIQHNVQAYPYRGVLT